MKCMLTESHAERSCSAYPTTLFGRYHARTTEFSAASEDDIAHLENVPCQPFASLAIDSHMVISRQSRRRDIGWVDHGPSVGNIVFSVQLAPEGASLDVAID